MYWEELNEGRNTDICGRSFRWCVYTTVPVLASQVLLTPPLYLGHVPPDSYFSRFFDRLVVLVPPLLSLLWWYRLFTESSWAMALSAS